MLSTAAAAAEGNMSLPVERSFLLEGLISSVVGAQERERHNQFCAADHLTLNSQTCALISGETNYIL